MCRETPARLQSRDLENTCSRGCPTFSAVNAAQPAKGAINFPLNFTSDPPLLYPVKVLPLIPFPERTENSRELTFRFFRLRNAEQSSIAYACHRLSRAHTVRAWTHAAGYFDVRTRVAIVRGLGVYLLLLLSTARPVLCMLLLFLIMSQISGTIECGVLVDKQTAPNIGWEFSRLIIVSGDT